MYMYLTDEKYMYCTCIHVYSACNNEHLHVHIYVIHILFPSSYYYYSLVLQWRFSRGVKDQTKSFMEGFEEVVPIEWISIFDERELEVNKIIIK